MAFCVTFICSLLICLTYGQSPQQAWGPEDLKSPLTNSLKCGFADPEPAYICDPNGILGRHVHAINWILKDVAYNSTCPCSNYYCETTPKTKPTGYKIGIALVKRMKVQTSTDGKIISPTDRAQEFAYTLENSKWNMGSCEEDIVVFYSVADKTLAIYTGVTASQKLTPYYKDLISYKAGSRLDSGKIVEGLNHIIHDIKLVLNCASVDRYDCNLYEFNPGLASTTLASFSLALTASLFAIFSKKWF